MKKFLKSVLSVILVFSVGLVPFITASAGWKKSLNRIWTYTDANGVKATGWLKLNSVWYYFDDDGIMQTDWQYINNAWYYFDRNGAMVTGWKKISNAWYYFDLSGKMKTGWQLLDNAWYYLNSDGSMKTGWFLSNDKWYYFSPNGPMKTGWVKVGTDWYYMSEDGVMQTGWLTLYGKEYYLLPGGKMATGFVNIDAKAYFFDSDGVLSMDTIAKRTEYEQKVISIVNEIRAEASLHPLTYATALSKGASVRANEISLKFDHIRPDGSDWYTVFEELGQDIDGTGENIAKNYKSPEMVVEGWMDSISHKKNILSPDFYYIGVAYLEKASGASYWVQLFSEYVY